MKKTGINIFILCSISIILSISWVVPKGLASTTEEKKLLSLINIYRGENKLKPIESSEKLNLVAQLHASNLQKHYKESNRCNLHSWVEEKGKPWKTCCYTDNHSNAECMWEKPAQISNYKGNGYEIAAYSSDSITAEMALKLWIESNGHNNVMLNKGIWRKISFKGIGVGLCGNYAVVWFGEYSDNE